MAQSARRAGVSSEPGRSGGDRRIRDRQDGLGAENPRPQPRLVLARRSNPVFRAVQLLRGLELARRALGIQCRLQCGNLVGQGLGRRHNPIIP